jgi:predicted P-loop ATPase
MIVLIGDQGLKKSMGISSLCPDVTWFADDIGADIMDKKASEGLRGKWLIEFGEFARINRATLHAVKNFLSRQVDHYRPSYGHFARDFPRTCIFIGTTNDDHPLHDRQNRRFMPIRCKLADMDWIIGNRDQLWAEAVARYHAGAQCWIDDPTLLAEIELQQDEARQSDFWETLIDSQLGSYSSITMEQIISVLDIHADRLDRSTQTRIGLILKTLGYRRTRPQIDNKRSYQWARDSEGRT